MAAEIYPAQSFESAEELVAEELALTSPGWPEGPGYTYSHSSEGEAGQILDSRLHARVVGGLHVFAVSQLP
jgi:hypothetical protein